jgi:ATP-binding cassette subfamily B protein
MKNKSIRAIKALISELPSRRKRHLILLSLLMLAGAFAEIVSLGLIVPFLAFLIDPLQALQVPIVARISESFDLGDPNDLRWKFTLLFAVSALASGAVRLVLIVATARIAFGIGFEIGSEIYRQTIYQSYAVHISRSSSDIIGGLDKVEPLVWILYGLLNAASAVLVCIFILITLLVITPSFTAFVIITLGGVYAALMRIMKTRLEMNSQTIAQALSERIKIAQEGLGSIRDILLDHSQQYFINRFNKSERKFRMAQAFNYIVGPSPRFVVEALGMVMIAGFAYTTVTASTGITTVIPALGAMALGAQRLLPTLQTIYIGVTNLRGQEQTVIDVIELSKHSIDEEIQKNLNPLRFDHSLDFENVDFQFSVHSPMVLKALSFSIAKGDRVGFMGPTGSGKSTTIDLLMGLLTPSSGQISVDDIPLVGKARLEWQKNIAHVPQDLYLIDATFAENIAFCVPLDEIDLERLQQAAKSAHIHDFIVDSPVGYQGLVGERGIQLSGGQRQRIGIARALYKRTPVLVFDEATSALDTNTETAVMSSIAALNRDITIIMIAHRASTLKHCDYVYQLEHGQITENMEAASI